jgi:hypothetical protein
MKHLRLKTGHIHYGHHYMLLYSFISCNNFVNLKNERLNHDYEALVKLQFSSEFTIFYMAEMGQAK